MVLQRGHAALRFPMWAEYSPGVRFPSDTAHSPLLFDIAHLPVQFTASTQHFNNMRPVSLLLLASPSAYRPDYGAKQYSAGHSRLP